jgi:hypothetical protein
MVQAAKLYYQCLNIFCLLTVRNTDECYQSCPGTATVFSISKVQLSLSVRNLCIMYSAQCFGLSEPDAHFHYAFDYKNLI